MKSFVFIIPIRLKHSFKNNIWNPKLIITKKIKNFKLPLSENVELPNQTTGTEAKSSKIFNFLNIYENLIGISDVKLAQRNVIEAEKNFLNAVKLRKENNLEIGSLQVLITQIRDELDKTSREEDKYLDLITREHKTLRQQSDVQKKFKENEENERVKFQELSSAVRESHENEKIQNEKGKYISLLGSLIGILLGFICSNLNNNLKMKQLKTLIITNNNHKQEKVINLNKIEEKSPNISDMLKDLTTEMQMQQKKFETFLNDLKIILSIDILKDLHLQKSRNQSIVLGRVRNYGLVDFLKLNSINLEKFTNGLPHLWAQILHNTTLLTNNKTSNIMYTHIRASIESPNDSYNKELKKIENSTILEETHDNLLKINKCQDVDNNDKLLCDMRDIKNILMSHVKDAINLTYVDKEQLLNHLNEDKRDLEWRLKMNSLALTVVCYSVCAILLPILYSFFKN